MRIIWLRVSTNHPKWLSTEVSLVGNFYILEEIVVNYDVIIIGAGPGGIFSAYELSRLAPEWKIAVFEAGNPLHKRSCPIDGKKVKHCIGCKS